MRAFLLLLGTAATSSALRLPKHIPGVGRRFAITTLAYSMPGFLATAYDSRRITAATAAEDVKLKFKRLSPIQFIAAKGDPDASSGTGAEKWGLWREDPGPRGVYLRDRAAAKPGSRTAIAAAPGSAQPLPPILAQLGDRLLCRCRALPWPFASTSIEKTTPADARCKISNSRRRSCSSASA